MILPLKMKFVIKQLSFLLLLFHMSVSAQTVTVHQTNKTATQKLTPLSNKTFGNTSNGGRIITIDGNTEYQTMDGFGAAMTGSSAYLMNQEMNSTQRNSLMNSLFTSGGINLSFVRHSIGSSDFSLSDYTYHDPGTSFSIDVDKADVIPMLLEAKSKNSQLKILGTPWTAPAWMKDNFSMMEGSLKNDHYDDYALYLVRYMKAFADEGLPIYAITMQNEPLHTTSQYPSMRMEWYQQSNLLRYDLGPLMAQENLNTKVLLYDHNWDVTDYAIDILNIPQTAAYAAGTAFHGYGGAVGAQSTVYNSNTSKGIWFTEQSGGDWSTDFGNNLNWYAQNLLIGGIRNWSKSVLLWNLALDTNNGPQNGGCNNCRGVVTVNPNGSFDEEVEYYALGHLSKFVEPGAKRVKSNDNNIIKNVAFKNPDGSLVLVAFNASSSNRSFKVRSGGKQFKYTLSGGALVTFKWSSSSNREEDLATDLNEELIEEKLSDFIYPNPISDWVTIDLSKHEVDKATFTLVNLQGQVVYEHHLSDQVTKINLKESFESGVYIAFLDSENFSKRMKIFIE